MAVREHRLYSFNGNDDGDKCYLNHQAVATGMRMLESIGELTNKSPPPSHPLPCTKHFPLWQSHAGLPPHALHLSRYYYIACTDITSLQPLLTPMHTCTVYCLRISTLFIPVSRDSSAMQMPSTSFMAMTSVYNYPECICHHAHIY